MALITSLLVYVNPAPASLSKHHSSIKVEFNSDKIDGALGVLDRYPEYKLFVEEHIDTIRKGKLTRIHFENHNIAIEVTDKYIDHHSLNWLASMFVHEARHHQQWYLFRGTLTDQELELDANKVQAVALYHMKGDDRMVANLLDQDGLHFDTNGNGILDAEDNWGW